MQEDHLHQESTTDDESGSYRSGSSSFGQRGANVAPFRIEKHEDMVSSELSDDPKMQELVQYVRRQSSDMAKEIDSVLTSTDESDEDSLKRARTSGTGDSRDPMDPVKERLRLLLIDRKAQKDVITAQKAEIQALRNASKSSSSGGSLELVALQGEISELRRDNETFKARLTESLDELRKKDGVISQLEARTAKLVQQNDEQSKLIDNLNDKVSRQVSASTTSAVPPELRGGTIRKTTGGLTTTQNNTFESDFQALDAALGVIDGSSSGNKDNYVRELEGRLNDRESEVERLRAAVQRLEVLAFNDSSSDAGSARKESSNASSQIKFLKETNDEQNQTIKLQKSTIGSLKEEVELLTRQISEHSNTARINTEKLKEAQSNHRLEQARLAEQAEALNRDKQEFAKHLKEFKELRKELFEGHVTLTNGAGVPKSRYRLLRQKRDKYKRKDYRKGHEMNAMQKRLLQNVELLEVEDSQSSSTAENANASTNVVSDRDESVKSQSSHKSVQLVHDSSSEHGDSE